MKSLYLIINKNDEECIKHYCSITDNNEEKIIIAPTFDGRLLVEKYKLPYKTFEGDAWKINKNQLFDLARKKAFQWSSVNILHNNLFKNLSLFKDYPIQLMHQSLMLLAIYESLQCIEYLTKIIDKERPDNIYIGKREEPFQKNIPNVLTESNGLERETVKNICEIYSCKYFELSQKKYEFFQFIIRSIKKNIFLFHLKLNNYAKSINSNNILKGNKDKKQVIQIYAYADYYIEYLKILIEKLIALEFQIVLIIKGGKIEKELKQKWIDKNVDIVEKNNWYIKNKDEIMAKWRNIGLEIYKDLTKNSEYNKFFSHRGISYFKNIIQNLFKYELQDNIPQTINELLVSESLLNYFRPNLVISHFSIHPHETCDVLPAKKQGITTLSFDHGVNGYTDSQRNTFASDHYAVSGKVYKKALMLSVNASDIQVHVIGNTRYDILPKQINKNESKRKYGLDVNKPVCIFCDSSQWSHSNEWRYSTYKTIEEILKLKDNIPALQIIYRVHHGIEYSSMIEYFKNISIKDIFFQISPDPSFLDIVQVADVVISHYSSAISEALLCGVPVIYLCAASLPEPSFFKSKAIIIADRFEQLPKLVESILKSPLSREEVKNHANKYIDTTLNGNDGKASDRLVQLIIDLLKTKKKKKQGFDDWINRIKYSSEFSSEKFNKLI